ncbi:hypothetical protein [Senegalimassilia anaerobia]|uniref:hypothetical protein n=1 Tax=Senegalimassilia anaerobia TaxID=1473216 RepID=UPI002E7825FB|nr:hypothetical protein [Senegalimassilia anaerobia]MEE0226987.1 hypothetical protein [Senegalimassilia anaerobia]
MFCVQIAEVLVAIENRYAFTERLCADYIVDALPDECNFSVSATPEEIAAENSDDDTFSPAYCESLALYRKICTHMLDYNAFLLHAAILSYAGRGFAFAAKSGTGKSTHVAQWMRALGDDVTVVNGDKPILRWRNGEVAEPPDGTPSGEGARACTSSAVPPGGEAVETACDQPVGEFIAYGTPYCGKENWGQNTSVPLRAVCFIERCEPGEPDHLSRLEDDGEIVARIMNQILMPHDPALAVRQLDLLDRLVNGAPFYVLRCTPTPAAFDATFQMTLCDNGRERMHRCEGSGHED